MVFAQSSRSVLAIDLDQTSRAAHRVRTPAVRVGPTGREPPSNDPNGSPGKRLSCTTCRGHPRGHRQPRPGERRRSTLIYMALAFRATFLPSRTLTCLLLSMDGPHHGSTGDSSPKRSRTRRQRQFAARKYFFLRGLFVGLYVSFPGGCFGGVGVLVGWV